MTDKLSAVEMLDREFLEIRCRLLDIASALDRIEGADDADAVWSDPRLVQVGEAIDLLTDRKGDRARRIQMAFSDAYHQDWRKE